MELPKPGTAEPPLAAPHLPGPPQPKLSGGRRWLADDAPVPRSDSPLPPELADQDRLRQELVQAQKMEAIGQLVSGVAHELNNPLAGIVAFSQLIRQDPRLPVDLRHDADLLVEDADRTRRIVQNLLDFARQRPPERHPTQLRTLIQSVLDLQAYSINAGQIDVVVDVDPALPLVPLDRPQMQQVVLNLTLNAIQAITARGGRGRLAIRAFVAEVDGDQVVRLVVADDGPGVAEENRDRLFAPFFTTKDPGQGTGLGLSVSFGIVAAHGGTLHYEPGPNDVGSTFVTDLPIGPAAGAGDTVAAGMPGTMAAGIEGWAPSVVAVEGGPGPRAGMPRPAAAPEPAVTRQPRVLVLDDEPSIRRFLLKALESAGFEVLTCALGREAVELIHQQPFDAMLCDHRMAGMTGIQVFEAVVAIRPELARSFVFMSGDVLNPSLRDFAESHGVGLLAKPFDLESVRRAVHAVVDRSRPTSEPG